MTGLLPAPTGTDVSPGWAVGSGGAAAAVPLSAVSTSDTRAAENASAERYCSLTCFAAVAKPPVASR